MKRVSLILLISIIMFSNSVFALDINEYPPYINLNNRENYEVEKIISSKEVIIRIRKKGETTYYSWAFNRNEVGDSINIDFEVNFSTINQNEIDELTKNSDKKYISFKHHGDLPATAKITVYVGDKYKNGDELYLYYYNEEENKIEFIDKDIKVSNGYVEFSIDHCSDYFLTKKGILNTNTIVDETSNISRNMSNVIMGLLTIITILMGVTLFSNKK